MTHHNSHRSMNCRRATCTTAPHTPSTIFNLPTPPGPHHPLVRSRTIYSLYYCYYTLPSDCGPHKPSNPSWSPRFRLRLSRSSARVNCHRHCAGNCKQGGGGDRGRAHYPRSDRRDLALASPFFPPLLVLLVHPVTSGRCPVTWRRRANGGGAGPPPRRRWPRRVTAITAAGTPLIDHTLCWGRGSVQCDRETVSGANRECMSLL